MVSSRILVRRSLAHFKVTQFSRLVCIWMITTTFCPRWSNKIKINCFFCRRRRSGARVLFACVYIIFKIIVVKFIHYHINQSPKTKDSIKPTILTRIKLKRAVKIISKVVCKSHRSMLMPVSQIFSLITNSVIVVDLFRIDGVVLEALNWFWFDSKLSDNLFTILEVLIKTLNLLFAGWYHLNYFILSDHVRKSYICTRWCHYDFN